MRLNLLLVAVLTARYLCLAVALKTGPASPIISRVGTQVIVFCWEDDESGAQDTVWKGVDGQIYDPQLEGSDVGRIHVVGNRICIDDLARDDHGWYRCMRRLDNEDHVDILIEVALAPSLIDPRPVQQIVMGETALILCRYIQDAYPAPTVDWYKNQLKLQLDDRVNATTDGLIIRDVREDDQGTYRCWVENKYGEDFLDITVAFQAPPQWVNNLDEDNEHDHDNNNYYDGEFQLEVSLGATLLLDCAASGAPPPTISWEIVTAAHDSSNSSKNDSGSTSTSTSSASTNQQQQEVLVVSQFHNSTPTWNIDAATLSDSGRYDCTSSNAVGNVSRSFVVLVYVRPVPSTTYEIANVDSPTSTLVLHCAVEEAHPDPRYHWVIYDDIANETHPLPLETSHTVTNGNKTLVVEGVSRNPVDSARGYVYYLCIAENGYGESRQFFKAVFNFDYHIEINGDASGLFTMTPSRRVMDTTPSATPRFIDPTSSNSGIQDVSQLVVSMVVAVVLSVLVLAVLVASFAVCMKRNRVKNNKVGMKERSAHTLPWPSTLTSSSSSPLDVSFSSNGGSPDNSNDSSRQTERFQLSLSHSSIPSATTTSSSHSHSNFSIPSTTMTSSSHSHSSIPSTSSSHSHSNRFHSRSHSHHPPPSSSRSPSRASSHTVAASTISTAPSLSSTMLHVCNSMPQQQLSFVAVRDNQTAIASGHLGHNDQHHHHHSLHGTRLLSNSSNSPLLRSYSSEEEGPFIESVNPAFQSEDREDACTDSPRVFFANSNIPPGCLCSSPFLPVQELSEETRQFQFVVDSGSEACNNNINITASRPIRGDAPSPEPNYRNLPPTATRTSPDYCKLNAEEVDKSPHYEVVQKAIKVPLPNQTTQGGKLEGVCPPINGDAPGIGAPNDVDPPVSGSGGYCALMTKGMDAPSHYETVR